MMRTRLLGRALSWTGRKTLMNRRFCQTSYKPPPPPPSEKKATTSIEKLYQKKTQREHILLRPEMYVGSVKPQTITTWIPKFLKNSIKMSAKDISIVPGIYKIFDEIIVNAADNVHRSPQSFNELSKDSHMSYLKVDITEEKGELWITVENDGACIPVQLHQQENMYVPELIFGQLLTGSNYNDATARYTGGRNGYGAKLTNIFSKRFEVQVFDAGNGKLFCQEFYDNMSRQSDAKVSEMKGDSSWTRISFCPDLALFSVDKVTNVMKSMFQRRVIDVAACNPHLRASVNGHDVSMASFSEYVKCFPRPENSPKRFSWSPRKDWEICVGLSEGEFQQTSFVNSIATLRGGTHVDAVVQQIVKHVIECAKKREKDFRFTSTLVKPFVSVFLKGMVANPVFDSQTKETLVTPVNELPLEISTLKLSADMIKSICESTGIVQAVIDNYKSRENAKFLKTGPKQRKSSLINIPKLEDANFAGTKRSADCTLIVTEGDSAKALAVAGLSVVGRDLYGVFPLRGKMLNVRESSTRAIMNNAEISHIKNIVGLRHDFTYETEKEKQSLRYGKIMLMTDQDPDGSHICGLFVNMVHRFWPALLHSNDFLERFITPLIKVRTHAGKVVREFYSTLEFEKWKEEQQLGSDSEFSRRYSVKYYKGLGTSTPQEAKAYFSDLSKHHIAFEWMNTKTDDRLIDMAFGKDSDKRKKWLENYVASEHKFFDLAASSAMSYQDFMNYEFILFSMADNERSIPFVIDGLKPGQRKVLFGCFKRNLTKEIKVAQLSGYVSEQAQYHHGETSLHGTIVGMAQNFVGSNNINLLEPVGQFGTRHLGGKDHASARYIYTKLANITRKIFRAEDDALLEYVNEDGSMAEPTTYVPIIPMVLVNGGSGIGSGFSTNIPSFNPVDIIGNLRRKLEGEDMVEMTPWFKGFTGDMVKKNSQRYESHGKISVGKGGVISVTELPVKRWTQDSKVTFEQMIESDEGLVKSLREYHTDEFVRFELNCGSAKNIISMSAGQLLKQFKLVSSVNLTNMNCFDVSGRIKRYHDPREIIDDFFPVRLNLYERRRAFLIHSYETKKSKCVNQKRFIEDVRSGSIDLSKMDDLEFEESLRFRGFEADPENPSSGYSYLSRLPITAMSKSRFEKLETEIIALEQSLKALNAKSAEDLWLEDLAELETLL